MNKGLRSLVLAGAILAGAYTTGCATTGAIGRDIKAYNNKLRYENPSGPVDACRRVAFDGEQSALTGAKALGYFPYCWRTAFRGKNADGDEINAWRRVGYALWSVPGTVFKTVETTQAHLKTAKDTLNVGYGLVGKVPGAGYPVDPVRKVTAIAAGPFTGENETPERCAGALGAMVGYTTDDKKNQPKGGAK